MVHHSLHPIHGCPRSAMHEAEPHLVPLMVVSAVVLTAASMHSFPADLPFTYLATHGRLFVMPGRRSRWKAARS